MVMDPDRLTNTTAFTEAEIARRKEFLGFGDEDVARLAGIREIAEAYVDPIIDAFYEHLLSFEESREFLRDPALVARLKEAQKTYFLRLTQGNYDAEYVEERVQIGAVHERIDLPTDLYLGAYNFYLRAVAERLFAAHPDDPPRALAAFLSLLKLVEFDKSLAIETYVARREATIRQQQAVLEFSTPVMQVRDRLLIVPVIGVLDSHRAQQLTEQLLQAIHERRAKVVVLDITGVASVDSMVANHLIQTVLASRLMGAHVIITGISVDISQTLVRIGVDLGDLQTAGDLQSGMELAERLLSPGATIKDVKFAQEDR